MSLFTCKPLKFPPKMALFARNRKSIFPLHRETLVSEIPVRLSPYTVLLNYFLHTINFIHTFPPNVLITHSPPYIPALLMVDHAVSFNHKTLHIYHCTRVEGPPNHTSATIKPPYSRFHIPPTLISTIPLNFWGVTFHV